MENLLKPDVGLMFWTLVTFLTMVVILKKVAWGPLLKVLEDREESIRREVEGAKANREQMEKLKGDYERQLSEIEQRARALLQEAEHKGLATREAILKDTEYESRKLMDKTRQQLEAEKERLVVELRKEVGELSIQMTEKLLKQNVDRKVQDKFIQDFIQSLDKAPK